MNIWFGLPPTVRATLTFTLLALMLCATGAAAGECIAVDHNDLPRDCTLSERLGACGNDAYESWATCVDGDRDGYIDTSFLETQACNLLAAVDLAACAVEVPWEAIKR